MVMRKTADNVLGVYLKPLLCACTVLVDAKKRDSDLDTGTCLYGRPSSFIIQDREICTSKVVKGSILMVHCVHMESTPRGGNPT